MKTMTTEFGGLVKSFAAKELEWFAEQLVEAVVVRMPAKDTNSNQTVVDLCESLMRTVDLNDIVLSGIKSRLLSK